MEKVWEWMHKQSMTKRCIISFIVGFITNLLLLNLAMWLYDRSGLVLNEEMDYYLSLFPVFTCLIVNLLNEELWPSLLGSFGAAMAFLLLFIMKDSDYIGVGVIITVIFVFQGICFYMGTKEGIVAAILRVLCLVPVFYNAMNSFELYPMTFRILLFLLGLACFLLTGRKNAMTVEGIIALICAIIIAATPLTNLFMYVVFLIFNPGYYP